MPGEKTVSSVIAEHESSGRYISVNGLRTFALDYGRGETVLCVHGVPTSSFLYRKVLTALAKMGYRGISIDFPGLGLSDRPENFDYSFRGLADFLVEAVTVLKLRRFHLVVHDIGGPVGFALASRLRSRIQSLTILNTWIDVVNFRKPLVMRPFEKKGLGEAELKMITHLSWPLMFRQMGVITSKIPVEEVNAYVDLLKRKDNGSAFLKIMRNFDHSPEFRDVCISAVQQVPYPVQAIWGEQDPALTYERYGKEVKHLAGLDKINLLSAKHFLQEEAWLSISDHIVALAQSSHQA